MRFPTITGAKAAVELWMAKVAPWLVFAGLAAAMLFDPARATPGVPGATFAAALALAAVTFSYARTLKEGSAVRDELVFAGERLAASAVMFLVVSVVRYAANDVPRYAAHLFDALPRSASPPDTATFLFAISLVFSIVVFVGFLLALLYLQQGMSVLLAVANYRAKRRPSHADYFPANKALEERVGCLHRVDAGDAATPNGAGQRVT